MRLGLLEISVIIIVVIAVALITRIIRTGRKTAYQDNDPSTDITVKPVMKGSGRTHGFFRKSGVLLVLTGVILLLAGVSIFKWALQSYAWSFLSVVIGFLLVYLSKKK